jgi:mono/diheme cytochrome c family protein
MLKSLNRTCIAIASVGVLSLVAGYTWHARTAMANGQPWITPATGQAKLQGVQFYTQFCAACHGAQMQGQFNWRERMSNGRLPAPPHDDSGHTWHHSDQELIGMIKYGIVAGVNAPAGYESDMPGFASVLSDEQIRDVLGYIKTYWSRQSLQAQREITVKR